MRYKVLFFLISVFCLPTATKAQQTDNSRSSIAVQMDADVNIADLIGLTVAELFTRFGIPQSVHSARGLEAWQDDVVFVYTDLDFYLYRNRVWQVGLKSAYGIRVGQTMAQAAQTLGSAVTHFDTYFLYTIPSRGWPLILRANIDQAQRVSAIFVYRPDI